MTKRFSAQLRSRADRIWRAIDGHPFLRELHAGTLSMNRFTYFILQDYVYLLDFAQVLALGAAKSPDLETLELFCRHALGAVEVERSFHASFGKSLGLTRRQLDEVSKGPMTQAYIGHLQSVARGGTLGEIVAAVLPCYWIYGEVRHGPEWFPAQPVREQIELMNQLGAAAKGGEKRLMTEHFILSSRYEFLFWEQAYRMEKWRV